MSSPTSVKEDASRLSRADRLLFRLESALNLLGGAVILALVCFATVNILGRWLFNLPIDGYVDWIEQAMAFMAFLGLAYTHRLGGHIRMDILVGQLRRRPLWLAECVSTLLMLALTLALIYGSWLHFLRAYQLGDSSLDIELPTWPAKLIVPVALSILALRLLVHLWAYARALYAGGDALIAAPSIEDAAAVAAQEAEAVLDDGLEGIRS